MKAKLTVLLALLGLALGLSQVPFFGASASPSLQGKGKSTSTFSDRRCEKCRRGDDGKMVCEPVPCP